MEIEDIELTLLINAIRLRYGHDLSTYALPSLKRRLKQALHELNFHSISELIPFVLQDCLNYVKLLNLLSITITEMFRDPDVYRYMRQHVIPELKALPYVKFWVAGCATGEEAYSLAIMLHEENLLERSQIFATDINLDAIKKAREGVYDKALINTYENNYCNSGGKHGLKDYFDFSRFSSVTVRPYLKETVIFAQHDLTKEQEFSEVHMILCRNVLMYFNELSQRNILRTFKNSLYQNGFLCIGKRETLSTCSELIPLEKHVKIFIKEQTATTDKLIPPLKITTPV